MEIDPLIEKIQDTAPILVERLRNELSQQSTIETIAKTIGAKDTTVKAIVDLLNVNPGLNNKIKDLEEVTVSAPEPAPEPQVVPEPVSEPQVAPEPDQLTLLQQKLDEQACIIDTLSSTDKTIRRFPYRFAYFMAGWSTLYITAVTFLPIPEENVRVVDTVVGFVLGTILAGIIGFVYGSSLGSRAKDRLSTLKRN